MLPSLSGSHAGSKLVSYYVGYQLTSNQQTRIMQHDEERPRLIVTFLSEVLFDNLRISPSTPVEKGTTPYALMKDAFLYNVVAALWCLVAA